MLEIDKLSKMNSLLVDLRQITDPEKICRLFLEKMQGIIDYQVGLFGYASSLKEEGVPHNIVIRSAYGAEFERDFFADHQKFSHYDYLNWLFCTTRSVAYRDSDLINRDLRVNSLYYKEFLEKHGLIYACGLIIALNQKMVAAVALYRDRDGGDFSEDDIFVLNYCLPHLEFAFEPYYKQLLRQDTPSYFLKTQYHLTDREIEIIQFILDGDSNSEIAQKLFVQTNTIKKHLYNIYAKFNISSRTQLFRFIVKNDLLDYFTSE